MGAVYPLTDETSIELPRHEASLTLSHNEHKAYYQTVAQYLDEKENPPTFVSEEERASAIADNELWELTWYPDTPVGFYHLAARNLDALLRRARREA